MKGALVFLAVFAIVLLITLQYPTLPPGRLIYDAVGGVDVDYLILGVQVATLVPAVFNGVVYGVIVWLLYSLASQAMKKTGPTQPRQEEKSKETMNEPKEKSSSP